MGALDSPGRGSAGRGTWCLRKRASRIAAVLALLTLLLTVGVTTPAETQGTAQPEHVTVFVIDLSGSMNSPFDGSRSKLKAAQESFLQAFPQVVKLGGKVAIWTYGDQLPPKPAAQRQENCLKDIRRAVPLGNLGSEIADIKRKITSFTALGDTPLGLALERAAADIPAGASATVLVFSDGKDECFDANGDGKQDWGNVPNPIEVARRLKRERALEIRQGVSIEIDTVGFVPDAASEAQLKAISGETGGTYTKIGSAADLPKLETAIENLFLPQPVRLTDKVLTGAPSLDGAPEIPDMAPNESVARYMDSIAAGEQRWYRAPRYGPGEGNVTATAFGLPAQEGIALSLRFAGSDGRSPLDKVDGDAGLPRSATASVRCPGCAWNTGEEVDTAFVVKLESKNPLAGRFDLELAFEGPAFGGQAIGCAEPQECFFEGQILTKAAKLEDLEKEYAAKAPELAPSIAERERLREEVAVLKRRAQEAAAAGPRTGWTVPLVLLVLVLAAGGGLLLPSRRVQALGLLRRPTLPAQDEEIPPADDGTDTGAPESIEAGRQTDEEEDEVVDLASPPTDLASGAVPAEAEPQTRSPDAAPASSGETKNNEGPGGRPIAAGWYDDPLRTGRVRWWDGQSWTDLVKEQGNG